MSGSANYVQEETPESKVLFEGNIELVSRIAHHTILRLPPGQSMDDYVQVGMMGLWEASKRYQPAASASFKTFAGIYIRGAILDELRRQSWSPRGVQAKSKRISQAMRAVEARLGRPASASEIAAEMEESLETYNDMLLETAGSGLVPIEVMESDGHELIGSDSPELDVQDDAMRQRLAQVIEQLPEREKLVISLYYQDDLNLREIGEVLGVGESRVCQIHSQAVGRIRSRIGDEWLGAISNA